MSHIGLLARSFSSLTFSFARQIAGSANILRASILPSGTAAAFVAVAFLFLGTFGIPLSGSSAWAQESPSASIQIDPATLGAVQPEQDPNQRPGFGDVLFKMLPMFCMVFFIFYFMVIKPQQQKLKSQQDLLQSLKKGDSVVTSGGIIAKVAGVESDHVLLDIAPNVRLKLEPSHIAKRFEKNPQEKDKAAA